MEKLPMCRICLVENVRMFVVVDKNLRELYEKLTDIPFVTEDSRPILACFFCFAKLRQCYRLLRQCLEAEELFAKMLNKDYEFNPLINQDHLEFCSGFIKSPVEHINIVDECGTESIAIKEELAAVCEGLDDIIEPNEEHQSDEPDNFDNSCLDVAAIPPYPSESDLEDDVPLMEFKTEVEEQKKVSKKTQRTRETQSATVAKNPKRETRKTKPEDAITAEQTRKDKSDSKVVRTTLKRTSTPGNYFKEPYKCAQRSINQAKKIIQCTRTHIGEKSYKCGVCQHRFSKKSHLSRHIRIHAGETPYKCDVCMRSYSDKSTLTKHIRIHTGEKPYKCDVCQRSFRRNDHLTQHIRIHTGEKPYKCIVCQLSFSQKGNLSQHIRIHTGEKPYMCDVCQLSFSHKGNLSQHVRIHTGENSHV